MATISAAFPRDANRVPITQLGVLTTKSLTTNATGATSVNTLFSVTGSVLVNALYGVVTTTLGSNQTAAYWRLNDQSAQVDISLNTGTTISSMGVGSFLDRKSVATVALTADNSTAGKVTDPVAATAPGVFMPFIVTQKVGSVETDIEFVYTTNQSPTTGAITFYLNWIPLTPSSNITAL